MLIDEIDASLHPKAQEKLLKLLKDEAREIGIQILFTTHSLSIIEPFCKLLKSEDGNIMLHYFTRENSKLKIRTNIGYENIKQDLMLPLVDYNREEKITMYSEDHEARWFIKKLLKRYTRRIKLKNVQLGCNAIIDIMNNEECFSNYLIVFDGDLNSNSKGRIKKHKKNTLLLPTDTRNTQKRPEQVIRDFIFSNLSQKFFSDVVQKDSLMKQEYFSENDIDKYNRDNDRETYKAWFKAHKISFNKTKIVDYWIEANKEVANKFVSDFIAAYNRIATKINIPKL